MNHWDDRLRKIEDGNAARSDEQRRRQAAEEREKRERAAALWSQVLDVAQWALGRYEAAQVKPLPVSVIWEVEVKPAFRKPHKESRRRQLGSGYPLLRYKTTTEHENYHEDFQHIVAVTPERVIIKEFHKITRFREYAPEIREIAIQSNSPVVDPAAVFTSLIIGDANLITPDYASNFEQVCDWIVEYVGERTKPGRPLPF